MKTNEAGPQAKAANSELEQVFAELQSANKAVERSVRRCMRNGVGPDAEHSVTYQRARTIYRYFWSMPGADAFVAARIGGAS